MSTLSKAPLIEAIVEVRWGIHKFDPNKSVEISFPSEDIDFFPGQFHSIAKEQGFSFVENINPETPPLPHLVKYRFRREQNTWPCYQIGVGVFTINQINEGYDWETFKKDILVGLDMLDKGHPLGLKKLPFIYIEIRYQDGFMFTEGENSSQFLQNKLNIGFTPIENFLKSPNLEESVRGAHLTFSIETKIPKGLLIINLVEGLINGRPGIVMNTVVRSDKKSEIIFKTDLLEVWLENAHSIQKHVFSTLIDPTYIKSFK